MSDEAARDPNAGDGWEELMRSMFGDQAADEALSAMRAQGMDPEQMGQAAGMPGDPATMQALIGQVQRMLSGSGESGPVNWTLAEEVAHQEAGKEGDPAVTTAQADEVRRALSVADLWLDAATDFPSAPGERLALCRVDWVNETLPTFRMLAEPVASSTTEAMMENLRSKLGDLPEDAVGQLGIPGVGAIPMPTGEGGMQGGIEKLANQLGQGMHGLTLGRAVGALAREVFGTTDISVPLLSGNGSALLPHNVNTFADSLEIDNGEVRLFLAVRELAHARLFAHVPWLRPRVVETIHDYARRITINTDAIEDALSQIDPQDPEQVQSVVSSSLLEPVRTEEQEAALARLETLLALIEGWVEVITARAVAPHLPSSVPLGEMIRRRRATGGPAEHTFAGLVGLQIRPNRLRAAAKLWQLVEDDRGADGRDELWSHPDVVPTAEELDEPESFVASRSTPGKVEEDLDAALAKIFEDAEADADTDQDRSADDVSSDDEKPGDNDSTTT